MIRTFSVHSSSGRQDAYSRGMPCSRLFQNSTCAASKGDVDFDGRGAHALRLRCETAFFFVHTTAVCVSLVCGTAAVLAGFKNAAALGPQNKNSRAPSLVLYGMGFSFPSGQLPEGSLSRSLVGCI